MSTARNQAAGVALDSSQRYAQTLYGIAVPALKERQDAINVQLAGGEPEYMKAAYGGQRANLTESMAQQGGVARSQQMAGSKAALSGGNQFANMNPVDIGSQLANALYGSRFAEGQANINQTMNMLGMALGGAGEAGAGSFGAAQQQMGAIGMLPNYNQTYANVAGGLAGGASLYGMLNKYGLFDPAKTPPSTGYTGSGSGVAGWG